MERGLRQNCGITNCQTNLNTELAESNPPGKPGNITEISTYKWGEYTNKQFEENGSSIYEKIVYWKRNIFLLPISKSGRCFTDKTTRLIHVWVRSSSLKNIALNAVMIIPSLLLQKPSKTLKTKDHTKALERKLQL